MKKIILILFVSLMYLGDTNAQTQVTSLDDLELAGYSVGVTIDQGDGTYLTEYVSGGRCKARRLFCRRCAGCCNSGYAETDADDTVLRVRVNNEEGPVTGQLFYGVDDGGEEYDEVVQE